MAKWQFPAPEPGSEYIRRLRELAQQADERIENQHIVSKVLLKGFAARGDDSGGWQLTPFDMLHGHEMRSRGLKGCGRIPNFLKYASRSAERIWQIVEDQLHDAIKAARTGQLFYDESHVQTIISAIALHLVRSIRYLEIHHNAVEQAAVNVRSEATIRYQRQLEAEFLRRHGLLAVGPEALSTILDEPINEWLQLEEQGALARASIERMFWRVRETLLGQSIEVLRVPVGQELLIADCPAITLQNPGQEAGLI